MPLIYGISHHVPADRDDSHNQSWYLPLPNKKTAVFGVLTIESGHASVEKLKGLVKHALDECAGHSIAHDVRLETIFENLTNQLNRSIASFFNHESIIGLHEVSAAIGIISDNELIMTGAGTMRALFVREDVPNTFHVFDLLKSLTKESPRADAFFGALVAGDMRPRDTLLVTTPATIDAAGDASLKRAVSTMEANDAAQVITHALDLHRVAGTALIIQCTERTSRSTPAPSSQTSIAQLRETEHETRKTLSGAPRLPVKSWLMARWISLRTALLRAFAFLKNLKNKKTRLQLPSLDESSHSHEVPRSTYLSEKEEGGKSLIALLGRFISGVGLFCVGFIGAVGHLVRHPKKINDFRHAVKRIVNLLIDRFNALPKTAKIMALGILVFVVLFTQSILYLNYRHGAEVRNETYKAAITHITELKDGAAASLIYADEKQARDKLLEAKRLATDLPRDSRSHRTDTMRLEKEIGDALVALRHEITVTPTVVATLPSSPDPKAFDRWLYRLGNPNESTELKTANTYDAKTVGQLGDGSVVLLDEAGAHSPLNVVFPQGPVTDAKIFGSKLYLLVPNAHQIYRLSRHDTSFSGLAPWLPTEDTELANAESIAIDGAIYALRPNGITKYFTGVREEWTPYIDPPLDGATRIWTDDAAGGIYILDHERIIVIGKQGNLLAQYIFPEGTTLRDFVVDEHKALMSVLAGNKIEHLPLTHLIK